MRQQQLALTAAGHTVIMVSAARGRGARVRTVDDGIEIKPLFFLPGVDLPIIPNSAATRSTLDELFESHGVEVVHVQTDFGLAHAAADVAATRSLPVIHTVHTFYWASEDNWFNPLAGFARWALTRITGLDIPKQSFTPRPVDNLLRNVTLGMAQRADTVVSPSAHQARDLQDAGVRGPVALVPNPVSTSPRPPMPLPTQHRAHDFSGLPVRARQTSPALRARSNRGPEANEWRLLPRLRRRRYRPRRDPTYRRRTPAVASSGSVAP